MRRAAALFRGIALVSFLAGFVLVGLEPEFHPYVIDFFLQSIAAGLLSLYREPR